MLASARIVSGLFVVTFGFAWTVGQAGLETTNRNLCDLVAAISFWPIPSCSFANWIVWLWGVGALLALIFLIVDAGRWWRGRRSSAALQEKTISDLSEHFPDVRVADSPTALGLFDGEDGDKMIPLLEAEKISAWARPMGRGEPAPIKVPGTIWRTHHLVFMPRGEASGMRNQTFLKTKLRDETSYYDLLLNRIQIRRLWPNFGETHDYKSALDAALLQNPERVKSSPLYIKLKYNFEPKTGYKSPISQVEDGKVEFQKLYDRARNRDLESYLIAGHMAGWLRENARFCYASSTAFFDVLKFIETRMDDLYSIFRDEPKMKRTPNEKIVEQNVTSHGQTGGITAHTVNKDG